MINILPEKKKREILAARSNVLLVRYSFLSLLAAFLLVAAFTTANIVLGDIEQSSQNILDSNLSRSGDLADVEAQALELQTTLQTAETIFGEETKYSEVLLDIAQSMPEGVVMKSITLDANTFGTPMTIKINARSEDDIFKLVEQFNASPRFSNVSFQDIVKLSESSSYPISTALELTINRRS